MFIAKLSIHMHADWTSLLSGKYVMRSIYCGSISSKEVMDIMYIQIPLREQEEAIRNLTSKKSNGLMSLEVLEREENGLIIKATTSYDTIISKVLKCGCFQLGDIAIKKDEEVWTLGAPTKTHLNNLLRTLRKTRKTRLVSIKRYSFRHDKLTSKQHEAISLAYLHGYYLIPRQCSVKKLARLMNISPSTCAVHLQKAEKVLVEHYSEANIFANS